MPVAPSSSFPIPVAVDLDFRPDTYVADWCALAAIVQNVTGDRRRHEVLVRCLSRTRLGGLMPRHVAESLDAEARDAYVAADPVHRAPGEWLPPYLPGELEIARLVVQTTPHLVLSLRARSELPPGRRPHFGMASHLSYEERRALRLVDEYGHTYQLPVEQQMGTFRLRDLVRCIDGVRAFHLPDLPEHLPFPEALVLEATYCGIDNAHLPDLVQVSSVVYPELHAFYRARLRWWVRSHFRIEAPGRRPSRTLVGTLAEWWADREDRA